MPLRRKSIIGSLRAVDLDSCKGRVKTPDDGDVEVRFERRSTILPCLVAGDYVRFVGRDRLGEFMIEKIEVGK